MSWVCAWDFRWGGSTVSSSTNSNFPPFAGNGISHIATECNTSHLGPAASKMRRLAVPMSRTKTSLTGQVTPLGTTAPTLGLPTLDVQMRDEDGLLGALGQPLSRSLGDLVLVSPERTEPTSGSFVGAAVIFKCHSRDVGLSHYAVRNELEGSTPSVTRFTRGAAIAISLKKAVQIGVVVADQPRSPDM